MTRSVVLLSGGLDSAVTLAMALQDGDAVALTFDYGQTHDREVAGAARIAEHYDVHQIVFPLVMGAFDTALIGGREEVPEGKTDREGIPRTYVPARNIIFLSVALGVAESVAADRVFIGANAIDYSGYPDCRPEFIEAYQRVADVGTKAGVEGKGVRIVAPLLDMTKAEIVRQGTVLDVPFELTWSCYRGESVACGHCDSCLLRLKGFREAGLQDPIRYEEG